MKIMIMRKDIKTKKTNKNESNEDDEENVKIRMIQKKMNEDIDKNNP